MSLCTFGSKADARRRYAAGFTLVELLVVISIIGMLMALLLPAVQQAREAGRRNTCSNNIRNCALAVANFANAKGNYPGYCDALIVTPITPPANATPVAMPVSWVVQILPYLERTDIYNIVRDENQWASGGGSATFWPQVYMDVLNCPSSPPPGAAGTAWCVYVANSGMVDVSVLDFSPWPADWQANGVFFNRFVSRGSSRLNLPPAVAANPPFAAIWTAVCNSPPIVTMTQDYITLHDGSSLTLMLSENNNAPMLTSSVGSGIGVSWGAMGLSLQSFTGNPGNWGNISAGTEPQNCFVFWPDAKPHPAMKINAPASATTINVPSTYHARFNVHPNSNHPGSVNVAFCDGHARTISQDIDYTVYGMLMTPYGQHCNTPRMVAMDAPNDPAGTGGSFEGTYYYPSFVNNYYLLRNRPVEEAQIPY